MRKLCFPLVLFVFASLLPLHAQYLFDPNDRIYHDLNRWEGQGFLPLLPPVRPYPPQLVKDLLKKVIQRGSADDAKKAQKYLDHVEKKFSFETALGGEVRAKNSDLFLDLFSQNEGSWWLTDDIRISGRLKGMLIDNSSGEPIPRGRRTTIDRFEDVAEMTLAGRKILLRQSQNVSFSVGNSDLWFQAGIMRSSFGPWWGDGVVVSADAPHAGHYSFVWRLPGVTFSALLMELSATSNIGYSSVRGDSFPDKHLIVQGFTFQPFDFWSVGFIESVVWGGRMELNYLLPFKELFYAQSMTGFADNSFVGVYSDLRLPAGVKLPLVVYIDDMSLNDLLKMKFANSKYKLALQGGVQWFPSIDMVDKLSLDYTMVLPYTYTHLVKDPWTNVWPTNSWTDVPNRINYTNYTHMGTNIGVGLQPNSDRLSLELLSGSWFGIKFDLTARIMRHGNASESIVGQLPQWLLALPGLQGSIFDHGNDGASGELTTWSRTDFLNQTLIETVYQTGITFSYSGLLKGGLFANWCLTGELGYLFEYIVNKDLVSGTNEANHYINLGLSVKY